MTYKLEPWVGKINAPITVVFPGGEKLRLENGSAVAKSVFDKHYVVSSIGAEADRIILKLEEIELLSTGWIGEEQQGFF